MTVYTVTCKMRHRRGDPNLLGNFDEQGSNLLGAVRRFLGQAQGDLTNLAPDDSPRILHVVRTKELSEETLEVEFLTGYGGHSSTFTDGVGGEEVFRRLPEHVENLTSLCLFRLPSVRQRGLLVAHSPEGRGVKSDLVAALKPWLAENHNVTVTLDPAIPADAFRKYVEQGDVKEIRWIRYAKPEGTQRALDDRLYREGAGILEVALRPSRSHNLQKRRLLRYLKGAVELDALLVPETVSDERFDALKVTVEGADGRQRTLDFVNERVPRVEEDIADQIELGGDGTPTRASLRRAALALLADYDGSLGRPT